MRRSEAHKDIHDVLVLVEVLEALPCDDPSQGVAYKVDPLVDVGGIHDVQFHFLCQQLPQMLNRLVHVILDSVYKQPVAELVVEIHKVASFLQIELTPLVPMHENYQGVHLEGNRVGCGYFFMIPLIFRWFMLYSSGISGGRRFGVVMKVFQDDEGVIDILVLVGL